jgi:hypothetical protein
MYIFSQRKFKSPATDSEHSIRKAEFDMVVGDLSELDTHNKSNLVMAINELYDAVNGKSAVASVLGLQLPESYSLMQIAALIQNDKNNLALYLLLRDIEVDQSESFTSLINKLYTIPDNRNHSCNLNMILFILIICLISFIIEFYILP